MRRGTRSTMTNHWDPRCSIEYVARFERYGRKTPCSMYYLRDDIGVLIEGTASVGVGRSLKFIPTLNRLRRPRHEKERST